jgi:mono/diheme cytochrome c family protein
MRKIAYLFALTFSFVAFAADPELEIVTPKKTLRLPLSEMKSKLTTHVVEIQDPEYKAKKSFDGFLLTDVFSLAGFSQDDEADEIVFTAQDGYSPNMGFDLLKKHVAYLAYQEHGKPDHFDLLDQGKSKVSPGPFYLVWKEGARLGHGVPWPYQLVKIETALFSEKYSALYPHDVASDSKEKKGFLVFKAECVRCHSINLQGGDLGPELNAPKNVTEYWRPELLREFIKDASSFRYKSKMPPFPDLEDEQIENVILFLRHMAQHKISKP